MTEFDNPLLLLHYLVSYPQSFPGTHEYGFQSIILAQFMAVAREHLETHDPDHDQGQDNQSYHRVMGTVIDTVTCLVSLARAKLVYDSIHLQLFSFCLECLSTISFMNNPGNTAEEGERIQELIKQFGMTARFLAVTLLQTLSTTATNTSGVVERESVLRLIRSNINNLLHDFLEDSRDVQHLRTATGASSAGWYNHNHTSDSFLGTTATGSGTGASHGQNANHGHGSGVGSILVKDAFPGISITNTSATARKGQGTHSVVQNSRTERKRVSTVFYMFLTNFCYSLALDDDSRLRVEAVRLLAAMAMRKKNLMEQLVGIAQPPVGNTYWKPVAAQISGSGNPDGSANPDGSNTSSKGGLPKEVDIFKDGISKLIPNSQGTFAFLDLKEDDNFGLGPDSGLRSSDLEETRFADFSFWVSENSARYY